MQIGYIVAKFNEGMPLLQVRIVIKTAAYFLSFCVMSEYVLVSQRIEMQCRLTEYFACRSDARLQGDRNEMEFPRLQGNVPWTKKNP